METSVTLELDLDSTRVTGRRHKEVCKITSGRVTPYMTHTPYPIHPTALDSGVSTETLQGTHYPYRVG